MALNLITNNTASIAHRNLVDSDREMTNSLSKLSSGQRVVSAKDDAASMAIGSRIRADVSALRQIQVNTTQATSMLQIAEGAHARVYDMLVRLKSLSSQAGSAQLSNTERNMLDTEYQTLLDEIDRVSSSTTFNGTSLVNAYLTNTVTVNTYNSFSGTNLMDFGVGGLSTAAGNLSLTMGSSGGNYVFTAAQGTSGKTLAATLDGALVSGGALIAGTAIKFVPISGGVQVPGDPAYVNFSIASGASFTITGASSSFQGTLALGGSASTSLSFKVGAGGLPSDNEISLGLRGINTRALGINASNISTRNNADTSYAAIGNAIDLLLTSRSEVGAGQARMESTAANVSVVIENMEAARSAYLDLDIAAEMSEFTNKQILQQAGVAMIAQANKLPENLLRLFQ